MCEKCLNSLTFVGSSEWNGDYYRCNKCGDIYSEEYIKHELLHDKWDDNWRDLFDNFRRYEQDNVQH